MPVNIESFEPLSDEECTELHQQKTCKTDPARVALLRKSKPVVPFRCRSWRGRALVPCAPPPAVA